jgi:hypothetical protein
MAENTGRPRITQQVYLRYQGLSDLDKPRKRGHAVVLTGGPSGAVVLTLAKGVKGRPHFAWKCEKVDRAFRRLLGLVPPLDEAFGLPGGVVDQGFDLGRGLAELA